MRFRMDATLQFWVDCSYEDKKYENANRTRAELIAEILREYERSGHAMRYLNAKGQIAWKASPLMLQKLADAEREVEDDLRRAIRKRMIWNNQSKSEATRPQPVY